VAGDAGDADRGEGGLGAAVVGLGGVAAAAERERLALQRVLELAAGVRLAVERGLPLVGDVAVAGDAFVVAGDRVAAAARGRRGRA
jgi:hypothetical protein